MGTDRIHGEYLKASPSARARLLEIINVFWHTEEWSVGRLIMLHKKGCKNNPNNYRAICLLCHAYKVLSNILLHRIAAVDSTISDCQNGFRPKRGCRDNLYILREVMKDRIEQRRSAVCLFVDYRAAFDSVRHDYLQQALTEHGIPNKLVSLIMAIYRQAKALVKGKASDSRVFDIDRGCDLCTGDVSKCIQLHLPW